jgi:hypothetical protein
MSGPKVVRIVTREEVQSICREQLRSLEIAASQLRELAERHGLLSSDIDAEIRARLKRIEELFEKDRFIEVQKDIPVQMAAFKAEMGRLECIAVERMLKEQQRVRQLRDAARSLSVALKGAVVPPEIMSGLHDAQNATRATLSTSEAALSRAFKLLSESKKVKDRAGELALAKRLSSGEQVKTFADWLSARKSESVGADARIERLVAEIEVLGKSAEADSLLARASKVLDQPSSDRRDLLTDSLAIELSSHVNSLRATTAAMVRLEEAIAKLGEFKDAAAVDLSVEAGIAAKSKDARAANDVADRIESFVAVRTARERADARRRAILGGLVALGYEVREGMTTAWAQSGRIVVRKPGVRDYGVELGAAETAEQVQVRLVGSANPSEVRSASRDRDAEVIWCSEFDALRTNLAKLGDSIRIERAYAVGEQPLKNVVFETAPDYEAQASGGSKKSLQRNLD